MRYFVAGYVGALAVLVAVAIGGAALVVDAMGPDSAVDAAAGGHRFSVVSWEMRHFPEKWLYKIGDVFFDDRKGEGNDDDILERYFNLTAEMQSAEGDELAAMEDERAWLENTVENIIEGRVTSVLEDEGLTMNPPPFTEWGLVFPPVDFEFDAPPRVLVTSPRDRIALTDDILLENGLDLQTVEEIEARAEADGDASALVVQTGGVATYPSVVSNLREYDRLIDLVFHEWLHQYLVFFPLGSNYFNGGDLRTLNESVASIGGRELAVAYFERYGNLALHEDEDGAPIEPEPTAAPPTPGPGEETFDFTTAMRALRMEVEAMLADGQVEEAEALMAEKRDEFEEEGAYIRRLNQAYFAFYGFYGDSPASIDPIGPALEAVFEEAESAGEFIRRVRGITSREELEALTGG